MSRLKTLHRQRGTRPAVREEVRPARGSWGVVVAYISCALIWGTTWYAVRVSVSAEGFEPFFAAALRATVACVLLGALWLGGIARPGPRTGPEAAWTAGAGILSAAGLGLVYVAEQWVSGGVAAILSATGPLFTAIVVGLTRIERVRLESVLGALISFAGILLIFQERVQISTDQALGVVLVLASVVTAAFSNVIMKRHAGGQHPLASAGMFAAVFVLLFWALAATRGLPLQLQTPPVLPLLATVYLGIMGSVVSFGAYLYLLKRVSLMSLTTLVFFPPILALGVDALFERAFQASASTYIGMAITLSGVAVSLLFPVLIRRPLAVRQQALTGDREAPPMMRKPCGEQED